MFKSSTSFYRHLNRCSGTRVECPECLEHMTVLHFYKNHASETHKVEDRKQCLFCFGKKLWPHGQKNRPENMNHLTSCLQRFIEEAKMEEERGEKVCGCRHIQPMPREMLGRTKDRLSEYVGFYDALLEKPAMWEEGIGKDVWGMIQSYLRQDWVWFHIMVKQDVFDTFRREMEKIRDQCVLLLFWCLCDGGSTLQHRHMILACEQESAFEDVWKGKVRYEFPKSGHAKKCVKIKNAFHLVRPPKQD